jgi:hypothetical protein
MNFNAHSNLVGQHAFLSASKYHWINYDDEKLDIAFMKMLASVHGTRMHAFAAEAIRLGINLEKIKNTLSLYVNDAIGYKMVPEQPLHYSDNCFSTADAICFRRNLLRIHDLKTGSTPASMHQLEVYTALFCLEYSFKPSDIRIELRLYQSNEILVHKPSAEDINRIMEKIIMFDKRIEMLKNGE